MALPLWMLKDLQIRIGQKIGLTLLFLVATISIVFDILRTFYDIYGGLIRLEVIIWDVWEPIVAVMISALPTYRALFKDHRRRPRTYRKLENAGNQAIKREARDGYELSNTLVLASEPESRMGIETCSLNTDSSLPKDFA